MEPHGTALGVSELPETVDVAVVGAGPGGLTAALYCVRAGLSVALLDRGSMGGQINNTEAVENYLGFDTIGGPELATKMSEHVTQLGIELTYAGIEKITREGTAFVCHSEDGAQYPARAVIVATGSHPRYLGVTGEQEYRMGGVSYCATCDGFFYRGKDVVVIGGGNAAVEESLYLAKIVNSVTVVHRRDELRAQKILQEHAFATANIRFLWDSVVEEIVGEGGRVSGVRTLNKKTGETGLTACQGVFIYVGNLPNNEPVRDLVELDESGYVMVNRLMETSVPGCFALGDVRVESVRQIASAVGDGATAAVAAVNYVNVHGR
jgi:thioredoxin reductase (NADPH)